MIFLVYRIIVMDWFLIGFVEKWMGSLWKWIWGVVMVDI